MDPNPLTGVFKMGSLERDTQGEGHLKTETVTDVVPAKDHWPLQEGRTAAWDRFSLSASRRNQPCRHLDFRLRASLTVRGKSPCCFTPPSLWYFVKATPGNEHTSLIHSPAHPVYKISLRGQQRPRRKPQCFFSSRPYQQKRKRHLELLFFSVNLFWFLVTIFKSSQHKARDFYLRLL